jgi:hypothetical protein
MLWWTPWAVSVTAIIVFDVMSCCYIALAASSLLSEFQSWYALSVQGIGKILVWREVCSCHTVVVVCCPYYKTAESFNLTLDIMSFSLLFGYQQQPFKVCAVWIEQRFSHVLVCVQISILLFLDIRDHCHVLVQCNSDDMLVYWLLQARLKFEEPLFVVLATCAVFMMTCWC